MIKENEQLNIHREAPHQASIYIKVEISELMQDNSVYAVPSASLTNIFYITETDLKKCKDKIDWILTILQSEITNAQK